MAWATREQAREHWPDAVSLTDAVLDRLLEAATEQAAAYAPVVTEPIPTSYVLATIEQARELYQAGERSTGDVIGFGDYAIRARPLSAVVKALLRPERGMRETG